MSDRNVTHIGFSDESNWNKGRFRSIGLITTPLEFFPDLNHELLQILNESGVTEFKWSNLSSAKERFAAHKMCKFATDSVTNKRLRIDVLVWDNIDSRHNVAGRDDVANLQRMYYHHFVNVLRMRWPSDAVWRLNPDEHTAMDWNTVQDCLENIAGRLVVENSLLTNCQFRIRLSRDFGVETIQQVLSHEHILLQLADLFAGMAVFSREKYYEYEAWVEANSKQIRLFGIDTNPTKLSRSTTERFSVLQYFDQLCKRHKLGVSLKTHKGLRTLNPENPLNFWLYTPTHPNDKAPTKGSK